MNNTISKSERITQNRIIQLFQHDLGYVYLGDFKERKNNSNIEAEHLTQFLTKQGHNTDKIQRVLTVLKSTANDIVQTLYQNNKAFYSLIRYGVSVKIEAGTQHETIQVIDWKTPENNNFYIAEEVTIHGEREKRPDIVLYVNGIALAVLELKNSRKSIEEGIRQNITNQQERFIQSFFNTIQFTFAGNDSAGLRYGTIGTQDKYYLNWKEDEQDNTGYKLDKYLKKICDKKRFLELIFDFILFDGGVKKLPRVHQYFALQSAQDHIKRKQGGIIWHTQGSGKSITMVLLAKWILENNPHARVLIITDRDELDKQIERVFKDAGEKIERTSSGRDLRHLLAQPSPRLLCSLVHKFAPKDETLKDKKKFEAFIKELEDTKTHTFGEIFVFVDECHRTQSGRLHKVMKAILHNAIFIGFTGTPLLKKDKATSLEVFGHYIHTYKFNEAVSDGVVLDLVYEARDIDQRIKSQDRIDTWFDVKTKSLNDFQKAELKKKWGTMQKVLSSKSRMEKLMGDILFDFETKPRLSNGLGNAILVASSIYEACRYYELFNSTYFKGKCGIITSYNPQAKDISLEDTGANTETEKEFIYKIYDDILNKVTAQSGKSKTETYEDKTKQQFIDEPANMRLLIVVSKLLTGFDAPKCTYLYIDKHMEDHGLFQAICRVNRLDGDTKIFGYIVDYKDLFKKAEHALNVYTSELDYDDFSPDDCRILLKDRLKASKERLDTALEALELLCEPVGSPKGDLEHIHYFCGNPEITDDLKEKEQLRHSLYKAISAFVRAYASISDDMSDAGYSPQETQYFEDKSNHYLNVREIVKNASGEIIDLKSYEADMRHLIDNYIQADDPRVISPFGDMPLIDIIMNKGIDDAIESLPTGIKNTREGISETIENNVRQKIIKDHLLDPAYFEEMSLLLDEIIKRCKQKAIEYEEYLKEIAELAKNVASGKSDTTPHHLNTAGKRALWNNLNKNEALALKIHDTIINNRSDAWRGNIAKENLIKQAIYKIVQNIELVETLFHIIKQQPEY